MDAARAAKRAPGVKDVHLVYRRTQRYMPADEEELQLAVDDGVLFYELMAPKSYANGKLTCTKMVLGDPDESGRRSPVATQETVTIPADTIIASVGAKIDTQWFEDNAIALDHRGKVVVNASTLEARDHIYVAGDAQRGAATVVQAIAGARTAADAILAAEGLTPADDRVAPTGDYERAQDKRGILGEAACTTTECDRCLECSTVCESCMDVCPNRANAATAWPSAPTIPHPTRINLPSLTPRPIMTAATTPASWSPGQTP